MPRAESQAAPPQATDLTALVPAYNEADCITETIRSLQNQTRRPDRIIVIDDCSSDNTTQVARDLGVEVLCPPENTGSKAGAQTFALPFVETTYCMAIDADTELAPDAIEKILPAMDEPGVAAACGLVLPRHVRTLWERGRYVEYLFAFTFFKQIQNHFERPIISSGCFSVYCVETLREVGGWSMRTMAEDMDLTWTLYEQGHGVRFVSEAVCYPIEPRDYHFMSCQLKRWSHGFIQNVQLHWKRLIHVPYLRSTIGVALWDGVIAAIAYLVLIPILAITISPMFLLGYAIDLPAVAVPVLAKAIKRKEFFRALFSLPAFLVLRMVNGVFMLEAAWTEVVMRRPLYTYVKGH